MESSFLSSWRHKHSSRSRDIPRGSIPVEIPKYSKDWGTLQRICESQTARILQVILEPNQQLPAKHAEAPSRDGWFIDYAVTVLIDEYKKRRQTIRDLQKQLQDTHPDHLAEMQGAIDEKDFRIDRLVEEQDTLQRRLKFKEEHIEMLKKDIRVIRDDQSNSVSDQSAVVRSLSESHEKLRKGLETQLDDAQKLLAQRESDWTQTIKGLNEELRKLQAQQSKAVSEDVMKENLRAVEERHRGDMDKLRNLYSEYVTKEEHERVETELKFAIDENKQLQNQHKHYISKEELNEVEEKLRIAINQQEQLKDEYKQYVPAQNLAEARRDIQKARNAHEMEIGEVRDQLKALRDKYDLKVSSFEGERKSALEDLESGHRSQMTGLRNAHREELKKLRESIENENARLRFASEGRERELNDQLQKATKRSKDLKDFATSLQKKHGEEEKKLMDGYQFQLGKLAEDHRREEQVLAATHKQSIDTLKGTHGEETGRLRSQVDTMTNDLKTSLMIERAKYLKKTEAVRNERDNLQKLLLQQERFSGLDDDEIARKFRELVTAVTDVSMSDWTGDHPIWKRSLLKKLSENQREIKQYILQDSLWRFLHQNIYCSPFRIFGELGGAREREWIQGFGQGDAYHNESFTWPSPTAESERFRFTTIEAAVAAMRFATSEEDPRAKYKTAFVANRDKFARELMSLVGEFTDDESIHPQLKKLISKAHNLWLDFSVQRCRLMIILPCSVVSDVDERVELAKARKLELTLKPILQRHGNGMGNDLDEMTIVAGCGGESTKIGFETGA